ncbi:galactosylceramide sulfotransferase [Anarhichas minor]|uniref:galactosylceramide sulfotransferase n=1 Tax=Anarhichas minor TaxID=65739 RepID=UPI003F73AC1E
MMSGIKGNKCAVVIRRLILWVLLTNIILVLYCLTNSSQGKNRGSQQSTCALSVAELLKKNVSMPSQSTKSQGCSPKVNIMFMKTHKTASSTILNILFRFGEKHKLKFALPDGRNDFFYPSPFLCSQVKDYRLGDCFNIVCNHMRFDHREVAKLLPPDAVYITILRDPVALFESSFHYYHRAVPLTWRIDGENKLAEFLNNPQSFYSADAFNSFYLRNMLFFDFGLDNNLEADDPRVIRDVHNLSKRFDLVLFAEYFEESLVLLKDTLCWTTEDILYFKLNARRSSSVSHLTPELRARALQWNGADWRLYQHFNATFWARVEAYGRDRMKQEVNELRRRNSEMRDICIEDGGAVEAHKIQDARFLPWQPVGESSILGYNMRKNIDPNFRTICEKMLTPEIQYLSDLGVNLWLTRLWGWLKDAVFIV